MKHRDFVILVRGAEEINALVASSHVVTTPATQTVPAYDTEHLTLVYLEPAAGVNSQQTGEALRNSIKTQIDVPPVDKGMHFGWREVGPTGEDEAESNSDRVTGTYVVPMAQLIELSHRIQSHGSDLEISPDAVVPSACTLIDRLTGSDPMQKSSGIDGDAGDWTQTAGEGKTDDTSPAQVKPEDQFKVGDIVRFTPESGNDQTKTFTIDGGELAGDNPPQWFWRLVELPGSLFLAASLELALPKESATS